MTKATVAWKILKAKSTAQITHALCKVIQNKLVFNNRAED